MSSIIAQTPQQKQISMAKRKLSRNEPSQENGFQLQGQPQNNCAFATKIQRSKLEKTMPVKQKYSKIASMANLQVTNQVMHETFNPRSFQTQTPQAKIKCKLTKKIILRNPESLELLQKSRERRNPD